MKTKLAPARHSGFTFIEALMTIAILGIMSALIVTAFSSAAADTNRIVSRQQQAALQNALNSWINGESNRTVASTTTATIFKNKTIEEIRAAYNGSATSLARLNLVSGYLDSVSASMFTAATTNAAKIKSGSLSSTKQYLSLPDWTAGNYPQVLLLAE